LPVRAGASWHSSRIKSAPHRFATSARRDSHSGGGTIMPPGTGIVSTMMAAMFWLVTNSSISSLDFKQATSQPG
jgi:hypothetical protein